jgi:O-antigen/teichoic acid export membrane protein
MQQQTVSLSLRRNFSWTMIGNLVYAGSQWGILVALTKLGSPEMTGQFTLGLAVTAPVFMLTNLQLRQIQATDAKLLYPFKDYLGLRLLCTQVALGAVMAIAVCSGYRWQTMAVVLLVGLAKGLESISDMCYGLFQQHERMDRIAISLMLRGPLALLGLSVGVWLSGSAITGVLGMVVAWSTVLIGYDLRQSSQLLASISLSTDRVGINRAKIKNRLGDTLARLKPNWNGSKLWPLVQLALPLGLVMMLFSLSANLPSYFIVANLGKQAEAELGIFNAIAYLMVVGNIIVGALGDSASPRLAKYYASGDRSAYGLLLVRLIGIGGVLGAGVLAIAIIGGGPLLSLLYSPAYAQRQMLFIWLMAGSGIHYVASFLGYGITAARYFKVQIPISLTSTICLAAACLWLIPAQGLMGAALALLIGAVAKLFISGAVILYALSVQPTPTGAS